MRPTDYFATMLRQTGIPPLTKSRVNSEHRLTSRRFLIITAGVTFLLCFIVIASNVYFDIFGLFRDTQGRSLPVYHNERISKYLLSYHYIPENYDGILIGTSLSANVAVEDARHFIYNASVMGSNIAELRPILQKCIDGGIQRVIFCISPYMFKNAEAKEVDLNDKLFYAARHPIGRGFRTCLRRVHQFGPLDILSEAN